MPGKARRFIIWLSMAIAIAACGLGSDPVSNSESRKAPSASPAHIAPPVRDCDGNPLPTCDPGEAGPSCDYPCADGFDVCSLKQY